MNLFFKWLLTPVLFWQMKDKRFVKIEIQYIAWSVACFFMTYRVAQSIDDGYPNTFWGVLVSLLYFFPFELMVFLVLRSSARPSYHSLLDLPRSWWISKLSLAAKWWFPLTTKEFTHQQELQERFIEVYGVPFGKGRMHWIHKIQFVILIGGFFLGYLLGK